MGCDGLREWMIERDGEGYLRPSLPFCSRDPARLPVSGYTT